MTAECAPPPGTPDGTKPVMPDVVARQRAWSTRHSANVGQATRYAAAIAEPPADG
jgi:hypothetical protein